MRTIKIPNIIDVEIYEDFIFTEETEIIFENIFDDNSYKILLSELSGYDILSNIRKSITVKDTPLTILINQMKTKIYDKLENNSFVIDENYIELNDENYIVVFKCKIKKIKRFSNE